MRKGTQWILGHEVNFGIRSEKRCGHDQNYGVLANHFQTSNVRINDEDNPLDSGSRVQRPR